MFLRRLKITQGLNEINHGVSKRFDSEYLGLCLLEVLLKIKI
jgi:hypothetical protein